MAVVKKIGSKSSVGAAPSKPKKPKVEVTLPTEKSSPSDDLSDYSMLLYGSKKIGKTSLAAQFPDALFLALEPGTKALRVFSTPVPSWDHADAIVEALEKPGGCDRYKTIVVDTVDILYTHAFEHICKKQMINHPQEENDYGATWGEIRKLFRSLVVRILNLPAGSIFISHDTEKEVTLRNGDIVDRVQPTMSKQAIEEVEGIVDIIGNYGYEGSSRVLRIDGRQEVVAGCRLEERFVRKGGNPSTPGDRVVRIPMGRTSAEAYSNFIKAFNNEQIETGADEDPDSASQKSSAIKSSKAKRETGTARKATLKKRAN